MDGFEIETSGPPTGSPWRRRLGTLALVLVGLIVFELSANPSLGVAVACLKFGLDDLRDGVWLRRADPIRRRGRAGFWMYLAVGFLRTSLIAFLGAVAMAIVASKFGEALGWPKRLLAAQLLGAMAVVFLGVLLASAASFLGVGFGLASRVKVWVGPEVRRGREQGIWPPPFGAVAPSRGNRAGAAIMVLLVAASLFAALALIGLIVGALQQVGLRPPRMGIAVLGVGLPIVSAILALTALDLIRSRLLARHPAECWPEGLAILVRPPASADEGPG